MNGGGRGTRYAPTNDGRDAQDRRQDQHHDGAACEPSVHGASLHVYYHYGPSTQWPRPAGKERLRANRDPGHRCDGGSQRAQSVTCAAATRTPQIPPACYGTYGFDEVIGDDLRAFVERRPDG